MRETKDRIREPLATTAVATAALACTLAMLGGCSLFVTATAPQAPTPLAPLETAGDTPRLAGSWQGGPVANETASITEPIGAIEHDGYGIPFATDEPQSPGWTAHNAELASNHAEITPQDTGAVEVGLFGEVSTTSRTKGGQFDGAGNLIQVTATNEGANFDPDIDRAGDLITFASTQHRKTSDIYLMSTRGRTMTQITSHPGDDLMPAFAPDSSRIAFASNRAGNWDIYYTNINGDPPVQVTFDADHELHPTWSPDGTMLGFCRLGLQSGRWEIWIIDVVNSTAPRFLEYGLFPDWNPDPARNKIVFQRSRDRGSRLFSIWTIDYVNGEALHPTEIVSAANAATMHPAWSPDGSRIVFVSVLAPEQMHGDRPACSDVWVIDVDGSNRANLTNGKFMNLYPAWAPDGAVYFLSDRSGVDNIWAVTTSRSAGPSADTGLVNVDPELERSGDAP